MYTHICIYVHINVHMNEHIHVHINVLMNEHISVHIKVHINVQLNVQLNVHINVIILYVYSVDICQLHVIIQCSEDRAHFSLSNFMLRVFSALRRYFRIVGISFTIVTCAQHMAHVLLRLARGSHENPITYPDNS